MKVKKGDQVMIFAGKDRLKKGRVLIAFPQENKILVEGINLKKKHMRPKKQGEKGEIVQIPAKFSVSSAKLICPKCNLAVRIGYKILGKEKVRICKKCQQEI